jgi:nucleoside-diphosphate-sugar epimerase
MNLVLGASGRLGKSLVKTLDAVPVDRSVYRDWWRADSEPQIAAYLDGSARVGTVFVAAGVIGASHVPELYERINFWLPRNLIAAASRTRWRVVTFGTVMETVVGEDVSDPYVASKIRLGRFVSSRQVLHEQVAHIRLHTLYGGGPPNAFMFLGQMFEAIRHGHAFKMSPGTQLREYHHVDDDAFATRCLVSEPLTGPIELSHGEPITLAMLACEVFKQLGCSHLLEIGALPAPRSDNYSRAFERTPALKKMVFRQTIPGVTDFLRSCLSGTET